MKKQNNIIRGCIAILACNLAFAFYSLQPVYAAGTPNINIVNCSASDEFYGAVNSVVNSLPPQLKTMAANNNVSINCYKSATEFSNYSNAWGTTKKFKTLVDGNASYSVVIGVFEGCPTEHIARVLYHELGHAYDYIIKKSTGTKASETELFNNCCANETKNLYNSFRIQDYNKNNSEYYAESFAAYWLANETFATQCPKLNAYWQVVWQ